VSATVKRNKKCKFLFKNLTFTELLKIVVRSKKYHYHLSSSIYNFHLKYSLVFLYLLRGTCQRILKCDILYIFTYYLFIRFDLAAINYVYLVYVCFRINRSFVYPIMSPEIYCIRIIQNINFLRLYE
jgi:hypothetical protein